MSWEQISNLSMPQFYFMISAYNEDVKERNKQMKRARRKK